MRDPVSCEQRYRLAIKIADAEVAKMNLVVWKNTLAHSRERLGDYLLRTGKNAEAREQYKSSLALFQAIAENDPKNVEAGADYSRVLYSLALSDFRVGDKVAAADHFKRSLTIRDARVRDRSEGVALKDLLVTQAQNRLTKEAIETAESVLKQFGRDPGSLVDVACCFAICSGIQVADAATKDIADRNAVRAVELLKNAIDLGYRDIVNLETEPDLDALRNRDDFKKLLLDLSTRR